MGIIRDSFVIFKDWDNAIRKAPEDIQLELYHAIMDFASTGEIPKNLSWQAEMFLTSIESKMKNNIAKYTASVENGKKGGNPNFKKGQRNPYYSKTEDNPNITQEITQEITQDNQTITLYDDDNDNDNVYDNVNDKDDDISTSLKNIFPNLESVEQDCELRNINLEELTKKVEESDYLKSFEVLRVSWLNKNFEEIMSGKYKTFEAKKTHSQNFDSRNYTKEELREVISSFDDVTV